MKESEYSIIFYQEEKIVGVSAIYATYEEVKQLSHMLVNVDDEFLPNQGKFDMIGYIKNFDLNRAINQMSTKVKK